MLSATTQTNKCRNETPSCQKHSSRPSEKIIHSSHKDRITFLGTIGKC